MLASDPPAPTPERATAPSRLPAIPAPETPSPARAAGAGPLPPESEIDRAELERVRRLVEQSGDPGNPDPATLRTLLRGLRRLAVVGISRDPRKPARRVPSYLAAKGIDVIPVNPRAEWLLGRPARAALSEVRETVDLVLVFRPSEDAEGVVREALARPERPAIWLQRGIFAPEAVAEARAAGWTVVQNACLFDLHRVLEENLPRPFLPTPSPAAGAAPG